MIPTFIPGRRPKPNSPKLVRELALYAQVCHNAGIRCEDYWALFGVTERTFYRDARDLVRCGVAVPIRRMGEDYNVSPEEDPDLVEVPLGGDAHLARLARLIRELECWLDLGWKRADEFAELDTLAEDGGLDRLSAGEFLAALQAKDPAFGVSLRTLQRDLSVIRQAYEVVCYLS